MELGYFTEGNVYKPFIIDRQNLLVDGKGRSGKSEMLIRLALDDINSGRKVIFIGNDSTDTVLKHIPKELQEETIYFNPSLQPMSANPFWWVPKERHNTTVELFIDAILSKSPYSAGSTPVIENTVTPSVHTLLSKNVESPLSLHYLLTDDSYRESMVFGSKGTRVVLDRTQALYWENFKKLSARDRLSRVDSTVNKLTKLVYDPALKNSFDQEGNYLSIENGITLISLDKYKLSGSGSSLAGALVIANLLSQADNNTDVTLYIDDAEQYGNRIIGKLLNHPSITTVLSTRSVSDFTDPNEILKSAKTIALQTSIKDAELLKKDLTLNNSHEPLNLIPAWTGYVMRDNNFADTFDLTLHNYSPPGRSARSGKLVEERIIDRCWRQCQMPKDKREARLGRFFNGN